jgi:hypothetical protein
MKRVRIVEFAALGLGIGLAPTCAPAQSVDIPLNYAVNTDYNYGGHIANPVLILTINVGVNGGPALPYAFDTGSSVFLTPNGLFTGGTPTIPSVESYGSPAGNTFGGNIYQIAASSLQYYAAPGATSGGVSLSTSGAYNVASYTSLNGGTCPRSRSEPRRLVCSVHRVWASPRMCLEGSLVWAAFSVKRSCQTPRRAMSSRQMVRVSPH